MQLGIALQHVIQCADFQSGGFLRHGGEFPMRGQVDVAGVGTDFAFNQGKQAGFAAAVFADEADPAAGENAGGGLFEQDFIAALQGEAIDFYHIV